MELIPQEVLLATGVSVTEAHSTGEAMALVSGKIKEAEGNAFCSIPFCVTVEAEAFGGKTRISGETTAVSMDGFKFRRIEELAGLKEMVTGEGRIGEVLKAAAILRKRDNVVVLNVEGPFTILTLLIDSLALYKGLKTHRKLIDTTLQLIEDSLVKYIESGIEAGAGMISYADPSGDAGLVGPGIYREISGKASYKLLKRLRENSKGALVHLCGKTSIAFQKYGFCTSRPLEVENGLTYGEALCRAIHPQRIRFFGHRCMKSAPAVMSKPVLWEVELS